MPSQRLPIAAATLVVAGALAGSMPGAGAVTTPMHVKVVGKEWTSRLQPGTAAKKDGADVTVGDVWGGREETSDPRVSGTYRITFDLWWYPGGAVHFPVIAYTLTNSGGKWQGASFGGRGSDGSHYVLGTAYGAGSFQGLRYRFVAYDKESGTASSHTFDLDGWIERGTAPASEPRVVPGSKHVRVTGKDQASPLRPGTETRSGTATITGNAVWSGTEETSDPRTTGAYRATTTAYRYPDGRVHFSGMVALANARGTWKGPLHGIRAPDGREFLFVDAQGTGSYRGLRFRSVSTGTAPVAAASRTFDLEGWIEQVK